jgi:hypothetical protein
VSDERSCQVSNAGKRRASSCDITGLRKFVSAGKQNHDAAPAPGEVQPIARAMINAQLGNRTIDLFPIAEVTKLQSPDPCSDTALRHLIAQVLKPGHKCGRLNDSEAFATVSHTIHLPAPHANAIVRIGTPDAPQANVTATGGGDLISGGNSARSRRWALCPRYRAWHNQEAMSVTPDELRKLLRAAPFRPFQLHLADQRTYDVPHPEFVAIQPAGRWIVVVAPNELGGYEVVNLPLIVSMTVLPEPPAGQQAA